MNNGYKPKVLIVDDEKGLRIGTKRLLEMEGYEVYTAENGTEGVNLGTSSDFDLALIDLRMPDIDGIQVLKEIKKHFPNTVCYITTAYASYDTAIQSTKLGAYGYIPKPFSPEELIRQLNHGYEKRKHLLETEKLLKEREERLLEIAFEKTRLNTIINSITDGVLVVNKAGEAVLFNPGALIFLGLRKIEIEEYIIDKLPIEIVTLINKFLHSDQIEKKSYSSQIDIRGNRELFIEATASPVPHPDGSLAGVVVVLKNITELKKIEHIKSQFVSMVSHELKAPIVAVYGYLQLLSDDSIKLAEEQRQNYRDRSLIRLDGLLKMVNDLLDISFLETKSVQREIKNINVTEVIKNILELFALEIKDKNLAVNLSEKEIPLIKADHGEITRLFTNLISNAIKYNNENGSIEINFDFIKNYIIISIKDTGVGIKPEEREKLFKEFFRARNEKTKKISGTGLGLSIVKRIVESYAGKIEVKSEYGKGSEFIVYLPVINK